MAKAADKARDAIDQAIRASKDVREGNYVTVVVEKAGLFAKPHIALTGRALKEEIKAKIQEIAEAHADGFEIQNRIQINTSA
jgi:hypothetical protein